MRKYYHFTSYENLEDINEYGLVPNRGGRTRSIDDNRNAIFLSLGIKNTILMYGALLHHYNSYAGNRGLEAIEFYKDRIDSDYEFKKSIPLPLDEEDIAEIEAMKKAIEWIHQIMEYKDFFDYMGEGVYLTISGIRGVKTIDPKDCYTDQIISPDKIKVVLLKNKKTGEIIDSRESILAYFMSLTPLKNIIYNTPNIVTHKIITDLYKSRLEDIRYYYNKSNFELEEMPINLYLSKKKNTAESRRKI